MIKCKGKKTVCEGSVFDIAEDFSNISVAVMKFYQDKYDSETVGKIVSNCIRCAMAVVSDDLDDLDGYCDAVAKALANPLIVKGGN